MANTASSVLTRAAVCRLGRRRDYRTHGEPCGRRASSRAWGMVPADSRHSGRHIARRGPQIPGALHRWAPHHIVGTTPEEVAARYRGCVDLVEQLQKTVLQFAPQTSRERKPNCVSGCAEASRTSSSSWALSSDEAGWVSSELSRRELVGRTSALVESRYTPRARWQSPCGGALPVAGLRGSVCRSANDGNCWSRIAVPSASWIIALPSRGETSRS